MALWPLRRRFRAADEALADENRLAAPLERRLQARRRSLDVHPGILVPLLGEETAAHVDPAVGHPGIIEVGRDDRRRDQLAEGHDRVVPQLGILRPVDRLGSHPLEFGEQLLDGIQPPGAVPQVVDDGRMVLAQRRDLGHRRGAVALLHGPEDPLEGVRGLAHRRNDDKEVLLVVDDLAQVAHPLGILHRGSSEFVYFHVVISNLIQPNFLFISPTSRPGGTAPRCSGTGRRTCRPPRRSASRWACRLRGPPSTRCG